MSEEVRQPKAKVHPLARTNIGVQRPYERIILRFTRRLTKYFYLDLHPMKEGKFNTYEEVGALTLGS